ncbi:MAG: hypothetical protein GXP08_02390 [Gammaproteobacteria bacterium]|nr:hypothetical protein [Gammaproteobacteria bacterium]
MLWASLFTTPFGLSEPLFVPEYWMPPSLFDLAENTGFDIESLIFCFGIGGIGSVFYNLLSQKIPQTVDTCVRHHALHRHHYKALAAPFIVFIALYFFPWNPIYPSIIAMFAGAVATILCRPDLKQKTWIGGLLFLVYYAIFLVALEWSAPGYIDRVWNMEVLSGVTVGFMPIEELLFAIGFGMYWSGVYEHFTWRKLENGDDSSATNQATN